MVGRNEGREAGRVDWDCVLGREAADGDCVPALRGVFERLVRLDILALAPKDIAGGNEDEAFWVISRRLPILALAVTASRRTLRLLWI